MKNLKYIILLFCCLTGIFVLTLCKEEPLPYVSSTIGIDKFLLIPTTPSSKDQVKMVTYDCKYNTLSSVKVKGLFIDVKKRFNSQMKWPCILRLDTIPLGQLSQGYYRVTFLIVDTNPTVKDSINVQEVVWLRVNK